MSRDPHEVLGLQQGASVGQIRTARRRLARAHHPDLSRDPRAATERMKEINRAAEILLSKKRPISVQKKPSREPRAEPPVPPPPAPVQEVSSEASIFSRVALLLVGAILLGILTVRQPERNFVPFRYGFTKTMIVKPDADAAKAKDLEREIREIEREMRLLDDPIHLKEQLAETERELFDTVSEAPFLHSDTKNQAKRENNCSP